LQAGQTHPPGGGFVVPAVQQHPPARIMRLLRFSVSNPFIFASFSAVYPETGDGFFFLRTALKLLSCLTAALKENLRILFHIGTSPDPKRKTHACCFYAPTVKTALARELLIVFYKPSRVCPVNGETKTHQGDLR
jgi:hypothetical protein